MYILSAFLCDLIETAGKEEKQLVKAGIKRFIKLRFGRYGYYIGLWKLLFLIHYSTGGGSV